MRCAAVKKHIGERGLDAALGRLVSVLVADDLREHLVVVFLQVFPPGILRIDLGNDLIVVQFLHELPVGDHFLAQMGENHRIVHLHVSRNGELSRPVGRFQVLYEPGGLDFGETRFQVIFRCLLILSLVSGLNRKIDQAIHQDQQHRDEGRVSPAYSSGHGYDEHTIVLLG